MIVTFLERGNLLGTLSRSQLMEVETQFVLYLIKAITFQQTMDACDRVLDEDQLDLHVTIKAKLVGMNADPDCNVSYKPAILKLAAGDASGFARLDAPTRRTRSIIARYRDAFDRRLDAVMYPIGTIGPEHASSMEEEHLERVRPHARRHVSQKNRFLTMGDPAETIDGMVQDMLMLALRAMRQYYPFRTGLHLLNTMRSSITNRSRSYVKSSTADVRRKLIQGDDGRSYRRETTWIGARGDVGMPILDTITGDENPARGESLRLDVEALAQQGGTVADVSGLVLDPERQDEFIAWLAERVAECGEAADVSAAVSVAVRRTNRSYSFLLSRFLGRPQVEVMDALARLRDVA